MDLDLFCLIVLQVCTQKLLSVLIDYTECSRFTLTSLYCKVQSWAWRGICVIHEFPKSATKTKQTLLRWQLFWWSVLVLRFLSVCSSWRGWPPTMQTEFLPAPRYAGAVYATTFCLSSVLTVLSSQVGIVSKRTNRACLEHRGYILAYPTLC